MPPLLWREAPAVGGRCEPTRREEEEAQGGRPDDRNTAVPSFLCLRSVQAFEPGAAVSVHHPPKRFRGFFRMQSHVAIPVALCRPQIGPPARDGEKMAEKWILALPGKRGGKKAEKWENGPKNGRNLPIFRPFFPLVISGGAKKHASPSFTFSLTDDKLELGGHTLAQASLSLMQKASLLSQLSMVAEQASRQLLGCTFAFLW